jgi:dinuclear metal center YbgI/SA1388 family protein
VPRLADVVAALDRRYPPQTAEPWDAVGLVCGDPDDEVRSVMFAVDPVDVVATEAIEADVDLIVTHHPLFLSGVHGVAATTPGGRLVHRLIGSRTALMAVHTNADVASPGVSDALAEAVGLIDCTPLTETGLGRVGALPEQVSLGEFSDRVAAALPSTAHGLRISGDLDAVVRRVAVCGGSGDSLLDAATAAGADVYLTADLKHHRTLDHRQAGGCAVIDVAHWASEWPWLDRAARLLVEDLAGDTVETMVSTTPTDPWSAHVRSRS